MADRYSTFSNRKPRARLKPMSDKRRREMDAYDEAVAEVRIRDRGQCRIQASVRHVRCAGPLDPHHVIPRSRAPKLWADPDNIILVCRAHHDWIHDQPATARQLGWLMSVPCDPRDD